MRWWILSFIVALFILAIVILMFFLPKRKLSYEYKPAGSGSVSQLVELPSEQEKGTHEPKVEKSEEEAQKQEEEVGEVTEDNTNAITKEAEEKTEGRDEGQESGEEASEEDGKSEEEKSSEDSEEEKRFIPASRLGEETTKVVYASFETTKGTFIIAIYPEIAPISATHFIDLIRAGFYDGIVIHRYEPNFVVQMGQVTDVTSKKFEFTKQSIQDEPNISENVPYTVSFAKSYQDGQLVPNSASTQFFINLGVNSHLDEVFTVLGQVIHGASVVLKLRAGDRIGSARIVESPALPVSR